MGARKSQYVDRDGIVRYGRPNEEYVDPNGDFHFGRTGVRGMSLWGRSLAEIDEIWVDPHGARRTKQSHPYTYDEFFLWGNRETKAGANGLYSDRIFQYDYDKATSCWRRHCGDRRWANLDHKVLSAFLSDYLGKPVKAVALAEGCNQGNGYPYWVVWFNDVEPKAKKTEKVWKRHRVPNRMPSKADGRKGTRRAWKRDNPPRWILV